MTDDDTPRTTNVDELQANARRHLWMHFSQLGQYHDRDIPLIMRGEGCYVWDQHGDRKLDGALGPVHRAGRARPAPARARGREAGGHARVLPDLVVRAPAGDRARDQARRSSRPATSTASSSRPADRRRSSRRGSSPRQYFRAIGQPQRYKVIARRTAYHGTTMGALAITGVPSFRAPFEPLTPGGVHVDEHQLVPPPAGEGRARVHDAHHRRDRGGDPLRRPRDRRRGDPRAGAERGRLPPAARGLLPAGARDLRPLRRAAHLRRGDLRVRPARHDVRRRSATTTSPT